MDRPRILVVEDNLVEQKLVQLLTSRLGFDVEMATTGFGALRLIEDGGDYSIVLMNYGMPAMNGAECAQRIRELEQLSSHRHVPIIAVSASASPSVVEACMEVGMDDYLTKPYTVQEFDEIINRWVACDAASVN